MSFFRRLFIGVLLGIYGLFSLSLGITLAEGGENQKIIIASSFSETCNWKIQCVKQESETYICYSAGQSIGLPGAHAQYFPIGKDNIATELSVSNYPREFSAHHSGKLTLYKGPDTFVYPFVRIIKIQV